jgi:Protein of unknown function (DUF3626)
VPPSKPPSRPPTTPSPDDGDDRENFNLMGAVARGPYIPDDDTISAARALYLSHVWRAFDELTDDERSRFITAALDAMKQVLDPNNSSVVLRTSHLSAILRDGRFRTQFETGRSGGAFNPKLRALRESAWFGRPAVSDAPPIYAAIEFHDAPSANADFYGDAAVHLKPDVLDRITVTVGDSLDNTTTVFPGHPDGPDLEDCLFASPAEFSRVTMTDDAAQNAKAMVQALRDFAAESGDYIEAQIHGGVLTSDIARIVFAQPPDQSTIDALDELGIEWEVS